MSAVVDGAVVDAAAPRVMFTSLREAGLLRRVPMLTLVFIADRKAVRVEQCLLSVDWVEVVESVRTTALECGAEGLAVVLRGMRDADGSLPEVGPIADLIELMQGKATPVLKDVFFTDGERYLSYMCEGCCPPEGRLIVADSSWSREVVESLPAVRSDLQRVLADVAASQSESGQGERQEAAWEALQALTGGSLDSEAGEQAKAVVAALAWDKQVRDYLLGRTATAGDREPQLIKAMIDTTYSLDGPVSQRLAGMAAAAMFAYGYDPDQIRQLFARAGDDSLAALVAQGLERGAPAELLRRVLSDTLPQVAAS